MKLLSLPILLILISLLVISCNNNQVTQDVDMEKIDTEQTRSTKHKIMSSLSLQESLANITKGDADVTFESFASLGDKNVSFVVFYEASAPWSSILNRHI